MAKIKDRNPYAGIGHKHKPRGVKDKEFEKVYWPFMPVILLAVSIIGLSGASGTLAFYLKHPSSKVLAYSVSKDPQSLLASTNFARESKNIADLTLNDRLSQAAQNKAKDMAAKNYWSHRTPDGKDPWVFASALGYDYQKLGENLATGFSNEASVVKAWMASAPHRENVLDPSYTEVGFGFANAQNYTPAGGGPMTIVVALYGRPFGISAASNQKSSSIAPSTDNSLNGKVLATKTLRSEIAMYKTRASGWATTAVIISALGVFTLFVTKHTKVLKRTLIKGEEFVWRHPLIDIGLVVVIAIMAILSQTAGYIQ